jgi:hypothetical protein
MVPVEVTAFGLLAVCVILLAVALAVQLMPRLAIVADVPMQMISWPPNARRQRRMSMGTSGPCRPR